MERTVEYLGFRGKSCKIVRMNGDWFDYRNNESESELPKMGAFCRKCAKESAKPVYPIYMNGRSAYALRCKKCGSEYPMYKSTFIERYVGFNTKYGHVNPTHGTKTVYQSMDRKTKQAYNNREKIITEQMCEIFHCTPEEYHTEKMQWEKERQERRKKFEREELNLREKWEDERRKEESNKRKELIEKGILKYVKNVGLVNTETGEIVKL